MKKILSTVAIFICAIALAGCSSSKTNEQSSVDNTASSSSTSSESSTNNSESSESAVGSESSSNTASTPATSIAEGTEKVIYSAKNADGLIVRYTLYYKDGKVTNEIIDTIRPYTYFEVASISEAKTIAEEEVASTNETYSNIKGFNYVVTTEGDNVIDTMSINFADGDVAQLIEIPGVSLVDDASNDIKIDEFEKALTESDYTKE